MLPAGTVLTYQAKGRTGYFQGESDIVQEMNVQFGQNNLAMRDYHFLWIGGLTAYIGTAGDPEDFQFTATIQLNNSFGAVKDVASIADHAIYQVTGTLPSSTVPNVTIPGQQATDTGQPGQEKPASTLTNPFDALIKALQSGVNSFALLMVGVILAVVLIIAGKSRNIL